MSNERGSQSFRYVAEVAQRTGSGRRVVVALVVGREERDGLGGIVGVEDHLEPVGVGRVARDGSDDHRLVGRRPKDVLQAAGDAGADAAQRRFAAPAFEAFGSELLRSRPRVRRTLNRRAATRLFRAVKVALHRPGLAGWKTARRAHCCFRCCASTN